VAQHDIVHRVTGQAGAVEYGPDHDRGKLVRGYVAQGATESSDGRPDRLADHGVAHGRPP
jgi:hypothetical protein